jgi:hypothetical protein
LPKTQKQPVEEVVEPAVQMADYSVPPSEEMMKAAKEQEALNNLIAMKVSEGIAAALPAVLAQMAIGQGVSTSDQQFPNGMGPSNQVNMKIGGDHVAKPTYLKHYRLDEAINGKHQLLDTNFINEDGSFQLERTIDGKINIPAVLKGEYVNFVGGHFYATREVEVRFIEWKIKTDPMSKIYEDVGGAVLPCSIPNCGQFFGNEEGLAAHLKATHGVGR